MSCCILGRNTSSWTSIVFVLRPFLYLLPLSPDLSLLLSPHLFSLSANFTSDNTLNRQLLPTLTLTLSDLDSFLQDFLNADASAPQADPQPLAVAAAPSAAAAVPNDFDVAVAAHHIRLQFLLLMQAWRLITPAEDQELLQLISAFQGQPGRIMMMLSWFLYGNWSAGTATYIPIGRGRSTLSPVVRWGRDVEHLLICNRIICVSLIIIV